MQASTGKGLTVRDISIVCPISAVSYEDLFEGRVSGEVAEIEDCADYKSGEVSDNSESDSDSESGNVQDDEEDSRGRRCYRGDGGKALKGRGSWGFLPHFPQEKEEKGVKEKEEVVEQEEVERHEEEEAIE